MPSVPSCRQNSRRLNIIRSSSATSAPSTHKYALTGDYCHFAHQENNGNSTRTCVPVSSYSELSLANRNELSSCCWVLNSREKNSHEGAGPCPQSSSIPTWKNRTNIHSPCKHHQLRNQWSGRLIYCCDDLCLDVSECRIRSGPLIE